MSVKTSKHRMERMAICVEAKRLILDGIENAAQLGLTYPELIHCLQEVQDRFIESIVVNEWAAAEESARSE